jgi:hypothetical protein
MGSLYVRDVPLIEGALRPSSRSQAVAPRPRLIGQLSQRIGVWFLYAAAFSLSRSCFVVARWAIRSVSWPRCPDGHGAIASRRSTITNSLMSSFFPGSRVKAI